MTESWTDQTAEAFLAKTLPLAEWTHEAHLRVGLWHLLRHPPEEALDLLRERIRGYNAQAGVANTEKSGYHETITCFYVATIAHFLQEVDRTLRADELARKLLWRYGDRDLPYRHWSKERLWSKEARLGWLPPDLQPLEYAVPAAGATS